MAFDKVVDSAVLESGLTSIANAIREKAGTSDALAFPAGFAEAIAAIESGGNTDIEDGLVARTLTEYTNNRVTKIGSYAFYYCSLSNVCCPAVKEIDVYAFYRCQSLKQVSFPEATVISGSAFVSCINLVEVSFPAVKDMYYSVFASCTKLETANFPAVLTLYSNAFANCSKLSSISFPALKSINDYAFLRCSSLTSVSFPKVSYIGAGAFSGCTSLSIANFPTASMIIAQAFRGCTSLTELYLMGSFLCSLNNSNAFSSAGITNSTGSIYVPASLLASYQTATNWAYFSTQFVAGD